jgi:predicted lipase
MPTDLVLAAICAEAYSAPADYSDGDVHAIRRWVDGRMVIAFRGTDLDDLDDWFRDLDICPMRHPRLGWCHRGFLSGALSVWPKIMLDLALARITPAPAPVILTGHSLGGALTIATGGLMATGGWPPAAIVTFGAPRVGLWKLRKLLDPVTIRQYNDGGDPVPDVPWPYLHQRVPIVLQDVRGGAMRDHSIQTYQAALAGS